MAELLGRISGVELAEWMEYEQAHGPLGPVRGDWQAASVVSTLVNINRGKRGKVAKIKDFLLTWKSGESSSTEMERTGRLLASRLGGTWTDAPGGGESDS